MTAIEVAIYCNRADSIRAGLDPTTTTLTVDLATISQDERDLLADYCTGPVDVTVPTVEALFETLRSVAERDRVVLGEVRDAHLAVLRERRTKTWQRETKDDGIRYDVTEPNWPSWRSFGRDWERLPARYGADVRAIKEGDEARAWLEELEAANRAAADQGWADQRAADESAARQREQAIARLRDWATNHGSQRVRLLIEEDYPSWSEIAEDEFFNAHTPDGYRPTGDGEVIRALRAPEAEDIDALRAARLLASTVEAAGEPDLVVVGNLHGRDREPGRSAIRLVLTAPHGVRQAVVRPVDEAAAAAAGTEPAVTPATRTPRPDDSG